MKRDTMMFSAALDLGRTEGKFRALICSYGVVTKRGDVVRAGAFDASLSRRRAQNARIPVVFNHEIREPADLIGEVSPFDTHSTSRGLIVSGELFLGEERADKVYALLKRGTLREWSFQADILNARPRDGGKGREFLEMDLFEVSSVLLGVGTTETLMVASAAAVVTTPLTPDELLAPYRSRFDVIRQRVARRRNHED